MGNLQLHPVSELDDCLGEWDDCCELEDALVSPLYPALYFSYFAAFLHKVAPVFPVFAGILCIATVAWLSNMNEELETRECTIYAVHFMVQKGSQSI